MRSKAKALAPVIAALTFCFCQDIEYCAAQAQGQAQAQSQDQLVEEPGVKARRMYGRGEFKQCFDYVEPLALGIEKKNALIQFYYAELLKKYGRMEEATAHFEEVLKLAPFGWLESTAKSNLRELRGPAPIQANPRFGGRAGYAGLRIKGNVIAEVFAGSPAETAGLKAGDIIVTIDGTDAGHFDSNTAANRIRGLEGTTLSLVVKRQGKQYATTLVRSQPSDAQAQALSGKRVGNEGLRKAPGSPLGIAQPSRWQPTNPQEAHPQRTNPQGKMSQTTKSFENGPSSLVRTPSLLPGDPQITVLRHTADSDAVQREIIVAMLQIPPDLRSTLASWGLKLVLAPTLLEALPELAGERPSGYLHGGSFTNTAGLYKSGPKTIYVTERVSPGSFSPQLNIKLDRTFCHEFGHALDHCMQISNSEIFMTAYQNDSSRLTNGVRDHFYYYTHADQAGPKELFAQLFACAVARSGTLDTSD